MEKAGVLGVLGELKTNEQTSEFWGEAKMEYVQTQDTRDKQKAKIENETSQRWRWSTSTDAPSSCGRGGAKP